MNRRPKSERIRRARLGNLRTLLRARCGPELPDDDAGREYLHELLLPISLGPEPNAKMEYAMEVWAPWMDAKERFHLVAQIERTPAHIRKVKAATLGERLRLTNKERERLRLWTIKPFDRTDKELAEQRKAKHRARMQQRRRAAGSKPQEQSLSRRKPWELTGVSRRTWERRRDASSCAVKLLNNRAQTCVTETTARPQEMAEHQGGGKAEQGSSTQSKPKDQRKHEPVALSAPVSTAHKVASTSTADETVPQVALRTNLSQPNGNGELRVRVWIKEGPAISSGADDCLDDFKIAARM